MRKALIALLFSVVALFVIACSSDKEDSKSGTNNDSTDTVTVEHELGKTEVSKNPEKVVVFDFGSLDTLDKLGIDVVGVPQANLPSYLDKYSGDDYENIGSLKEPDFEKIAEIDPDLIIISGRQSNLYDQLEELGDTIYLGVDTSRYMDSFEENAKVIGEIFEKEDEVESALKEIEEKVDQVKAKAEESDKKGLIVLANDDKISAYGENSRFGLIHDVFGVSAVDEDIEASTHGMNVSFEYVLEKNPDLLYVVDRSAAIGEDPAAKQIIENKLIEKTNAMKNDDITYLNPDVWYLSGGGLISVEKMLEEVSESLD